MIRSTSIHFNDDGTVWWVVKPVHRMGVTNTVGDDWYDPSWFMSLDQACDACRGDGIEKWQTSVDEFDSDRCTGCDGTGRSTFDLEVRCDFCHGNTAPSKVVAPPCWKCSGRKSHTHQVSVVPGMVLPIVADADDLPDCPPLIEIDDRGTRFFDEGVVETNDAEPITLPPDAKPGMWAVLLAVSP